MRQRLWAVDSVSIDLEDRDVSVELVHKISLARITVEFRLSEHQLKGSPARLKRAVETLAADKILDLASFLEGDV